jgi:hypothetical protein
LYEFVAAFWRVACTSLGTSNLFFIKKITGLPILAVFLNEFSKNFVRQRIDRFRLAWRQNQAEAQKFDWRQRCRLHSLDTAGELAKDTRDDF